MNRRIAPVFVSHGAPTLIVEDTPARQFIAELGTQVGRPDAIVIVSAHWETRQPCVGAPATFDTIHDFYGFPRELYQMRYTPNSDARLAERIAELIAAAGLPVTLDGSRGLDHGGWVPLKLAFPAADIPVVGLSIQHALGPGHHLALGRALANLALENIWIVGSGSATHNLGAVEWGQTTPSRWAVEFEGWLADTLAAGDAEALVDYRRHAPHAVQAHPRDEHLLPLFVAFGAAGEGAKGSRIHGSFAHGTLSMAAYRFA